MKILIFPISVTTEECLNEDIDLSANININCIVIH